MRFAIDSDLELFAASIAGALGGWESPLEPVFGEWQDDRDDDLSARLASVGWAELWGAPDLLGPAVAGGIELGRAVAPLCLVDEATLGAPLAVAGVCGTARGGSRAASVSRRWTARARSVGSSGPCLSRPRGSRPGAPSRSAYLAGLADGALEKAVRACPLPASSSGRRSALCRRYRRACRRGAGPGQARSCAWAQPRRRRVFRPRRCRGREVPP